MGPGVGHLGGTSDLGTRDPARKPRLVTGESAQTLLAPGEHPEVVPSWPSTDRRQTPTTGTSTDAECGAVVPADRKRAGRLGGRLREVTVRSGALRRLPDVGEHRRWRVEVGAC